MVTRVHPGARGIVPPNLHTVRRTRAIDIGQTNTKSIVDRPYKARQGQARSVQFRPGMARIGQATAGQAMQG